MAIQQGVTLRTNKAGQTETTVGTSPKLQIRTGAQPANCAAADSGTLLCEITCPVDWASAAAGGQFTIANGPWSGTGAAAGTPGHYRLKDNAGTTTHEQGTVGNGSGDLSLDSGTIGIGQTVNITSWTRIEGGA